MFMDHKYVMIMVHVHYNSVKKILSCNIYIAIMVLFVEAELWEEELMSKKQNKNMNIHFTLLSAMRHDFRTYAQTRPTIPNHRCKHT